MSTSRVNQILQSAARRYTRMTPDERLKCKKAILTLGSLPWIALGLYLLFDIPPSPRFDGMTFLAYIAALNCTIIDRSIRAGSTYIEAHETICYGENRNSSYSLAEDAKEQYDAHEFDLSYLHLVPGVILLIGMPILFTFILLSLLQCGLNHLRPYIPGEMLHNPTRNTRDILNELSLEEDLSNEEESDEVTLRRVRTIRPNRVQQPTTAAVANETRTPEIISTIPARNTTLFGAMLAIRGETIEEVIEDFHRIEL